MDTSVFNYHDPVEFLNSYLLIAQEKNPSFSLRSWAKQLDMNHVAMLSMVMNRKRRLVSSLASKISAQFISSGKFNETEGRYFDILVLFHNATTLDEKNFYEGILSSLRPDQKFSTLELDKLNIISEWYHSAILEMTDLKNFKSDPEWICLKLGDNVKPNQAKAAIERLLRLGLLEETKDGKLKKTKVRLATPSDIPSKSLRKYHSQVISKAITALETQSVENRDITSVTFSVDLQRLPEAKNMIRDFRRQLTKFLGTKDGDSVYQLNIQLFDLLGDTDEK